MAEEVDDVEAAASADNLVHFLITYGNDSEAPNNSTSSRPACRLTIPKCHLESRPNSYLSALSSGRWTAVGAHEAGSTASSIELSVDASPDNIRGIWGRYSPISVFVPLFQRAYESAAAAAAQKVVSFADQKRIELPHGLEMEDAVLFLRYYGILPEGEDVMRMVFVPTNGPAAVYLRSKLYPKEAKMIQIVRDALVEYIAKDPERTTLFVFADESDDNCVIEGERYHSAEEGKLVALQFNRDGGISSKENFLQTTLKTVSESSVLRAKLNFLQATLKTVSESSVLRAKLISHLTEEDKLEASFVADQTLLIEPYKGKVPGKKTDQQSLLAVGTYNLDPEKYNQMSEEELEHYLKSDRRILAWRFVLKVGIPDA